MSKEMMLEVKNLVAGYRTEKGMVRAVDGVSFGLERGGFLGIAGESGCGKSTLAYAIMRLLRDNAGVESGEVVLDGVNLLGLSEHEMNEWRWTRMAMVFQSAMNALNPVLTVGEQLSDAVLAHRKVSKRSALEVSAEMLRLVDINEERLSSFPHQLSGGMRQRVMIAMALLLKPDLLIMDEPTTALDVVVQRSILEKVDDLRHALGFSVIFITHDLSLLVEISNSLAIMYAGKICEYGPSMDVYSNPGHPYTRGLMNSFPRLTGPLSRMDGIEGRAPDLLSPPPGCRFAPRCPKVVPECSMTLPELVSIGDGRLCACRFCEARPSGGAA
jgi:peptide/nickel transport system ATP-binding protein